MIFKSFSINLYIKMAIQYCLLALLVLSSQGFSEAKSIDIHHERGLVEEVEQIIQQLVDLVKFFLDNSTKVLEELYQQLQGAAKEEFDKAIEQLQKIIAQVKVEIEKIINEVQGLGEEVTACALKEQGNLAELAQNTKQSMAACRATLLSKANDVFNGAKAAISESLGKVSGLWSEFKNCDNILCKINVAAKIPALVDEVKGMVNQQISIVQLFVKTEVVDYKECNQAAITEYVATSTEIKNRIETCVNNIGN